MVVSDLTLKNSLGADVDNRFSQKDMYQSFVNQESFQIILSSF